MTITVNGEEREVPAGTDVPGLLQILGLAVDRVAIERNRAILPREQWGSTEVAPGDTFEIVHFVGGG